MNRRGFLRFLGLAPVAAPMAISAASSPIYASGGYISGAAFSPLLGEACIGESLMTPNQIHALEMRIDVDASQVQSAIDAMRKQLAPIFRCASRAVETQMHADDLFEEFPTTTADALRQPVRATIVDQPSSADRLRRAWGSNPGRTT